jgi:hypothetical protein
MVHLGKASCHVEEIHVDLKMLPTNSQQRNEALSPITLKEPDSANKHVSEFFARSAFK